MVKKYFEQLVFIIILCFWYKNGDDKKSAISPRDSLVSLAMAVAFRKQLEKIYKNRRLNQS